MVSCSDCNARCCRQEVPLFGETAVPEWLVEVDEQGNRVLRRLEDGWCALLDRSSMRCTIYADRPFVCRQFELGGIECLELRAEPGALRTT
tara:strand:+ start:753 stop:1025 length:273 start_codon:yes stop_codon:yes gene_type:complete